MFNYGVLNLKILIYFSLEEGINFTIINSYNCEISNSNTRQDIQHNI